MLALVVQSSKGANSFRNSSLSRRELPTMSWHCSESPVVSVASKSVITITSFAVRSAMAARFLSQWKGAEGDQSQTCRRARSTRSAVMAAMAPITPASKLEGAIIMAAWTARATESAVLASYCTFRDSHRRYRGQYAYLTRLHASTASSRSK